MRGDDIHVAFDDHHLLLLANGAVGQVEAIDHVRFVKELRLRCVQIFGDAVVEHAAAEANHATLPVADREDQPPAEHIVGRIALLVPFDQPGFQQQVKAEAFVQQKVAQRRPVVGRKAEAK